MIASQYILAIGYGLILLYLPFCLHFSIPGYDNYTEIDRAENIAGYDIIRSTEKISTMLKKKGYRVKTHEKQVFLADMKMSQLHVIELNREGLVILIQELNRWPNPFKKNMVVLLSGSDRDNIKIKSIIKRSLK